MKHTFSLNGAPITFDAPADTLLIDAIREHAQLTGTHRSCDTAQCGACTVHLGGASVKSCNVLAAQLQPADQVTTIEGIGSAQHPHPLQRLFSKHHALQCGYCTPGMIMRGIAMQREGVAANEAAVRAALSGNLCRCTGYEGIVAAMMEFLAP